MEVLYLAMPGARKRIPSEGLRRGSRSGCIESGSSYSVPDGGTVQISTFVSGVFQRHYLEMGNSRAKVHGNAYLVQVHYDLLPGMHRMAKPKARKREAAKKQ
jgi:hypothetical protein